jgi:hypothetical protein
MWAGLPLVPSQPCPQALLALPRQLQPCPQTLHGFYPLVQKVYDACLGVFEQLPLAALVQRSTLVLHGGLFRKPSKKSARRAAMDGALSRAFLLALRCPALPCDTCMLALFPCKIRPGTCMGAARVGAAGQQAAGVTKE